MLHKPNESNLQASRKKPHRVAVFCGSNSGTDAIFSQIAQRLGTLLANRRRGLVYGGGKVGLMGVIADAVMQHGGEVIGVIPRLLHDREVAHHGITELHLVDSMHDRKRMMYELADVMIAMPGGIGTFEELFEALTWNQLGLHRKPCGLLNVDGYFDPLIAMLDRAAEKQFLRAEQRATLLADSHAERLLDRLEEASP